MFLRHRIKKLTNSFTDLSFLLFSCYLLMLDGLTHFPITKAKQLPFNQLRNNFNRHKWNAVSTTTKNRPKSKQFWDMAVICCRVECLMKTKRESLHPWVLNEMFLGKATKREWKCDSHFVYLHCCWHFDITLLECWVINHDLIELDGELFTEQVINILR